MLACLLLLSGCSQLHRRASPPAAGPAATTDTATDATAVGPAEEEPPPARDPLADIELGEAMILAGDWRGAVAIFDRLLAAPEAEEHLDRILLRSALIRLDPRSSLRLPSRGRGYLARLVAERPDSIYAAEAAVILALERDQRSLAEEVERLRVQLEELRRIDLGPPPSRRD